MRVASCIRRLASCIRRVASCIRRGRTVFGALHAETARSSEYFKAGEELEREKGWTRHEQQALGGEELVRLRSDARVRSRGQPSASVDGGAAATWWRPRAPLAEPQSWISVSAGHTAAIAGYTLAGAGFVAAYTPRRRGTALDLRARAYLRIGLQGDALHLARSDQRPAAKENARRV